MSPDLALQKALLARLAGSPDVTAMIPAADMLDGWGVPKRLPCLFVGEGQVVRDPQDLMARHRRAYAVLHIWTKTMPQARAIAGAITAAVEGEPLPLDDPHRAVSTVVASSRFMRDADGETAHGVVTINCLLEPTT